MVHLAPSARRLAPLLLLLLVALPGCDTWVCNRETCATGCCSNDGTCLLNGGATACGTLGEACRACLGGTCRAGQCVCGEGLELVSGRCVCTGNSCSGCCENSLGTAVCRGTSSTPQTSSACGTRGQTCTSCSVGSSCTGGQCCIVRNGRCSTIAGSAPCCGSTRCLQSAGEFRCL
ncbi:MAG: hypothetical protein INH41_31115 [Myxococcaceae bacterium]|nr:hypothetical protein [Myxococcaceae bacterium]MCA3016858.1 hypothetical protein [Myxococcaceae bacterium]